MKQEEVLRAWGNPELYSPGLSVILADRQIRRGMENGTLSVDETTENGAALVTEQATGKWFLMTGGWENDSFPTAMLGAACGDVAGSVYEFDNTRDYHFKLFSPESDITDDTVMTVAVAEWAMACVRRGDDTFPLDILERCMVDAARDYPHPKGGYGHAFHNWLFHPERLRNYQTGKIAHKRVPYHSYGNGSAMRVSSIGWLFDTLEETERVAGISASITHDHPEGIKGAVATAVCIWMAKNGKTKDEIYDYVIKQYPAETYEYSIDKDLNYLRKHYRWNETCMGSVPAAMRCFYESSSFDGFMRNLFQLNCDCDTLGAIGGAVAEEFYHGIGFDGEEILRRYLDDRLWEIWEL